MLAEIQANFADQLEHINKASDEQIARMAAEHQQAIERAKADAERARADFEVQMDRMREGHQQQLAVFQERVIAANNERAKADAERERAEFKARMEQMEMHHQHQFLLLQEQVNAIRARPRGIQCPMF